MAVISILGASHSRAGSVAEQVAEEMGYPMLAHADLLGEAAKSFSVSAAALTRTMSGSRPLLEWFTHERQRHLAYVRASLAERVNAADLVYHGPAALLLPRELSHVLHVGVLASTDFRLNVAMQAEGLSRRAARKALTKADEANTELATALFDHGPWHKELYDLLIPMDKTTVPEAVGLVCQSAAGHALEFSASAKQAVVDLQLAARVHLALAAKGLEAAVSCRRGRALLTVNQYVLRLEHFKQEIAEIAAGVPGVEGVETRVGPHFRQPRIYGEMDLESSPKILLVDDEEDFVLTLSERLQTRNLGSSVAHDGEQALAMLKSDAPDVMVLDLKMPGIDGLEVLRRVKKERPHTEVIILTGHGSDKEEKLAYELGAFAYLNKPVDIDVLANTMKAAYARLCQGEAGAE